MTDLITKTAGYVREQLKGEATGHDWWHTCRVWKMSVRLAEKEGADMTVVQLAALLHDIADWKFSDGDDTKGERIAHQWLESLNTDNALIGHVCRIIHDISFKGAGVSSKMETIEGKVVQDADRLDALGAIGIARTFAYGGYKGREIYNPEIKPEHHQSFEQYKASQSHTINHFYEKLLLLKGRMNTSSARKIAEERHQFLETFLAQFMDEWECR